MPYTEFKSKSEGLCSPHADPQFPAEEQGGFFQGSSFASRGTRQQ